MAAVVPVIDIMTRKVRAVESGEPVYSALREIINFEVGCVVVKDGHNVVGIITKGDILKRAVLKESDIRTLPCKQIMSKPVITIDDNATVEDASRLMSKNNVFKLPVINEKKELIGIVTSTDLIREEPIHLGYLKELVRARYVPYRLRTNPR